MRFLIAPAIVWGLYLLKANLYFRFYPVVMVALALFVFALSLLPKRTPLVETFARKTGEALDKRGVDYCRRVTWVWTVFLFAHLIVTLASVFASYEVWAAYNGFIAYVLMGALFVGEWLVRRRVKRG